MEDLDYPEFLMYYIKNLDEKIRRFASANDILKEIKENYVGEIYSYKYDIRCLITYLNKQNVDTSRENNQLIEEIKQWGKIEKKYKVEIADSLQEGLKDSLIKYRACVDFFSLDDSEASYTLWVRDWIEECHITLKNEFGRDVTDSEREVKEIDEKFKKIYHKNKEGIIAVLPIYEYPPYYPDSFWWRHPLKLFSGEIK